MCPKVSPSDADGPCESGSIRRSDCGLIVTGASGWIGRAVVRHARSEARVVVGAGRHSDRASTETEVRFDLGDSESVIASRLERTLHAASSWAVIHCAGLAHVRVEDRTSRDSLHHVNVDGTVNMTKACLLLGIQRFVQVSTIAVYDWLNDEAPRPRHENAAMGPATAYGASKLQGEREVERSGLDFRIARLATVFGTGDKANYLRMAKAIRHRRFVVPGRGQQRKSCIDVDSAAQALIAIANMPHPAHRIVNVAFPNAPTLGEISRALAAVCDAPVPPHIPESLLRIAAWCGDRAASLGLPTPLTSADLCKLCASTWVDVSRAMEMLPDLRPRTFTESMWQAAQYYRES